MKLRLDHRPTASELMRGCPYDKLSVRISYSNHVSLNPADYCTSEHQETDVGSVLSLNRA